MTPDQQPPSPASTPASPRTAAKVGDLVDGEILLPDFVVRGANGIEVDSAMMNGAPDMQRFVDRVFGDGAFFIGLDYAAFSQLLYPAATVAPQTADPQTNAPQTAAPPAARIRIAADIAIFAPQRRELYVAAKEVDQGARIEYMFSPARLQRLVEVPLFGEVDAEGKPVQTGVEQVLREEPTTLDADEFVAAMWAKGIRAGLDIAAIRAAIASGRDERICIARRVDPQPGVDATVQEQTEALHRDDSPAILPNGRVDLSQFKNRFPQVEAGTCLLKKQPRRLGLPGRDTDGTLLEAALPRDFNIDDLAGGGTRVERTAKGEFIFAARDGFLTIDTATQQVSITDKIINRDGVSLRTTGNLVLSGDHYEEHGEVQERRVVDGMNMVFHADVFGRIESNGGEVHLHANLAGGAIKNIGGTIRIDGRATSAVIEARGGEVHGEHAESTLVIAATVRLGRAVGCDIVADEVEIDEALGCTIAARRIRIARAGARRQAETLLTICLPDFTALDQQRTESVAEIAQLKQRIATRRALFDEQLASGGLQKYLAADQSIRSGALKLTPAQETQWRQATQKLAAPLARVQALQVEIDGLDANLAEREAQLADLVARRATAGADIRCDVAQVSGLVAVQTIAIPPETAIFGDADSADLKHRLRDTRKVRQRLFHDDSGSFSWTWTPPPD